MIRLSIYFFSILFILQSHVNAYSSDPEIFINELVGESISKLSDKSFLFCIIQLTLRSNCLVLENSPLKLDENLSLGKFFSLLFFALRIIINLQSELLSFLNLVEIVCKDFTHGGYQIVF